MVSFFMVEDARDLPVIERLSKLVDQLREGAVRLRAHGRGALGDSHARARITGPVDGDLQLPALVVESDHDLANRDAQQLLAQARGGVWMLPDLSEISRETTDFENAVIEEVALMNYPYYGSPPDSTRLSYPWLVWIDDRHEMLDETGYQMFVYDFFRDTERHVPTTNPDCCVSEPEIYEETIVYRDGSSNIYVYDIESNTSWRVAGVDEYDWDRYSPAIWGNTVAWHDTRAGGTDLSQTNTDIYMTDISMGGEQVVCDHPASQPSGVTVGDGFIVWPDARNDEEYPNLPSSATNWDIYLHDIATGDERQLTDLPGIEACPKIYKNRVYFVMEDDFGIMSVFEITLPEYEGAGE